MPSILAGLLVALTSVLGLTCAKGQDATNDVPDQRFLPPLTNVQQVLDLGAYQAREQSRPVRLRGTIVSYTARGGYVFLHDQTACILVMVTNAPSGLGVAKLVEVEGWTEAGLYAALVNRASVQVLGDSVLPPGEKLAVARMKAGEGCWQWVRVEGVVRDMNRDVPNLALSVAAENERLSAFVFGYEQFSRRGLPLDWLEARIVMDAICWTDINDRNQAVDFHLVMGHTNQIRFLRNGTTNLFAPGKLQPADSANLRRPSDDRVLLMGTVLARFPDDRLFLRTEFGPVRTKISLPISRGMPTTELVPRAVPESLGPGDHIELVGAPAESRFAPLLVDAEYRKVGAATIATAKPASESELASGEHDADFIRVVARLLTHERRHLNPGVEEALVLDSGGSVFEASWKTDGTNTLPALPMNARLEISGICEVQSGPGNLRRNIKLLLRGPADVRYLGQTHFWSQAGVGRVLGIATALVVGGGLWVLLLRRRVHERTAELAMANARLSGEIEDRRKAQTELKQALVAERELGELKNRFVSLVSHEFRTPLGITMSAVELLRNYLDRLPPAKLNELLDDIYSSTLRMSGLMEQVLLLGRVEAHKLVLSPASVDLEVFGNRQVDEMQSASNRRCSIVFSTEGDLSGARADEALLRHIFSNLLSNAMKYSSEGGSVDFIIRREAHEAVFIVRDRGIGIPESDRPRLFEAFHRAGNVGQISGTGLGLLIVKRCVELHQGNVSFESRVGEGTTFKVRLPLFAS